VCHGRTYCEIGALLFISEKTVEGHVTNLFAKLGVGRRAAIAKALASAGASG
jgi:DNA-binding CsgD family transcriptional regulator